MGSSARSILVLTMLLSLTQFSAAHAQPRQRCFEQTQQCVTDPLLEFWERNGGLPVFGYPLTPQREELIEGQLLQVQWFERQRLELHPTNPSGYMVELGRLGDERLAQRGDDWRLFPGSEAQDGCRYFPEVRHNLCGAFLSAWRADGLEVDGAPGFSEADNLALFGLPLSDEFSEEVEGKPYTVQWFERARFEFHPENAEPYIVLLGRLGAEVLGGASVPALRLPDAHLNAIREAARAADLPEAELEPEHVLVYSLHAPSQGLDRGVVFMLTPRKEFLAPTSQDVVNACGQQGRGQLIGGLSVVQQIHSQIPVGDYAMSLDPDCANVRLQSITDTVVLRATVRRIDLSDELPEDAVIPRQLPPNESLSLRAQPQQQGELPKPFVQPAGLISARQICQFVATDGVSLASVCAQVETLAPRLIQNELANAASALGVSAQIRPELGVPDVEFTNARARCARALATTSPPYSDCTPSLLLAAFDPNETLTLDPNNLEPRAVSRRISVMVALETVDDQVFADQGASQQAAQLDPGPYLASELRLPNDPPVIARTTLARLRLEPPATGADPRYIPIVSGLQLIPVAEQPGQAAIMGAFSTGCCIVFECFFARR